MTDATRDWKDTIRLPETEFPMRASLTEREPAAVQRWKDGRLYHRMLAAREGAPEFTLHDGPPYANGNIHHGHALNKILKDIIIKYRHLAGYKATNIPGWDCHGLPIEHMVDSELGAAKAGLSVVEVRKRCREYAAKWIGIQREQFERLMVLAEWERPYQTMSFDYEATIFREIGRFMEGGYVYNGLKPVHWSWAAVTALADAEVEYAAYTAPSVYVRFALPAPPAWLAGSAGGRAVDAVIWTTTPWTLPSNLAIVLHPELEYELLALDEGAAIILAAGLKESVFAACGLEDLPVLARFVGSQLVGHGEADAPRIEARHPFVDRASVLLPADYVTLEQGTGLVHTAPGHGAEDFETGRRFGLDVLAPVDPHGRYTAQLGSMGDFAAGLVGEHVLKANPAIAAHLAETGRLLNKAGDTYRIERYPHCWRTKKPLIFRATAQWFIDVDHAELRKRSLEAVGETTWIPHWGESRIRGMLEVRPDWCISRQRAWGVPIPAFECAACGKHVVSHEVAYHVAELCEARGADVWFEEEAPALVPPGFSCPSCGAGPDRFTKVDDILDVWFDSGVSWAAVLRDREHMKPVADLYLEGSDQHRGWFHTSLLASMGSQGCAPFEAVLTHGFVVDDQGHKYSKSSPNFEPLDRMLEQNGAEVLRLWVAMVDYRQDIALAPEVLKQAGGAYRKIRNTIRFLLGSLDDFDPAQHPLVESALTDIDRWALGSTDAFVARMLRCYEQYDLQGAFNALFEFCNETLSAVYLDVLKDRLYCGAVDASERRASQAVIYEALRAVLITMAPILTFTADEAWAHLPKRAGDPDSVFLTTMPSAGRWPQLAGAVEHFAVRLELRSRIHALIEARRPKQKGVREPGQIGSSQEAAVTVTVRSEAAAEWNALAASLAELAIVSSVRVAIGNPSDPSGVDLAVEPSADPKCPRCWNYRSDIGADAAHPELCGRCADVVRV